MCTNFKHPTAKDGTVCVGRTMEFPNVLPWQVSVIASNYEGASQSSKSAKKWTAKYGVVGMGADQPNWLGDGMNTAGLSAHALYMPDHATYYAPKNDGTDIGMLEVIAFILGTCGTLDEVKVALATCNLVSFQPKAIPVELPAHLIFHDKDSCIVAEFHPDGMVISDNPVQVATNAPYLDWHLTNVANYLSLTPDNPNPVQIGGTTFAPAGQGQGFRGLPADENSPSRFIRVLSEVRFAQQPEDQQAAIMDAIRILHGFDLVPGTVMEQTPGGLMPLLTMWSVVCDLTHSQYLFNSINNPLWYSIDLTKLDFSTSRLTSFPSSGGFTAFAA